ncbi:MAG: hypothetical protein PHX21_13950 [bacterium]|jgi:hypothetical protein|nr:hypothetical protein [bacterium]
MLYECVLYKDNVPVDCYSPIINEDDVTETEEGLHIIIDNNDSYDISTKQYDFYVLNEIELVKLI